MHHLPSPFKYGVNAVCMCPHISPIYDLPLVFPMIFSLYRHPFALNMFFFLCSRALDNQLFVAGVSAARDTTASYVAWGHSTLVNPW